MALDQTVFKYCSVGTDVLEVVSLNILERASPRLGLTEDMRLSFAVVVYPGFIESSEKVHCVRYGAMEKLTRWLAPI